MCLFLMKKLACQSMPGALARLLGIVAHGRLLNLHAMLVPYWFSA
jgi:hypothetical protein